MLKLIDGKYRVVQPLGEGFGGEVYLVEAGGGSLALKKLRMREEGQVLSSSELLDSFKREFSTLKKLNHPHILRILDFGFDNEERIYYFTTEFIQGQDIFQATRGLSMERIEELFVQTLRALGYLHSQAIYHFDLKPANILVEGVGTENPTPKIIDFGLAAFQKKGMLAGSPPYISPEALFDRPRDGRSDLYSLGVTWYQCLTGENPFSSNNVRKTLELHCTWMPPPVSTWNSKIPKYLDPILEKLLRKNPAQRFHRADQVIRALNWSAGRNYPMETEATALSYLPGEGQMVGREKEWARLLDIFSGIFLNKKNTKACVLLSGNPGTGKTRLLSELKYHAQLQTVPVLDLAGLVPGSLKSDALLLADDANAGTLEIARQWMQRFSTHSFMIVLAGRELPDTISLGPVLALQNLEKSGVERYTASILGVENPPAFLVEDLLARTEGNPLFLTDLLQCLIRSHQIFDEKGRWSISHLQDLGIDFQSFTAPKTLSDYCRSKVNRLPENCKKIVAWLAASRVPLNRAQLRKLDRDLEADGWAPAEKEKLIRVDPVTGQIEFVNPSFKDCILANLSPEYLACRHQNLGEILQGDPQYEAETHFQLGFGTGPPTERFRHLVECGESMANKFNWMEAARFFETAAQLAPENKDSVDVNLRRARILIRANRRPEALQVLESTREILKKEKENPDHWRWVQQTFRDMASLYLKQGRCDLAREAVQASMVLLEEHQEDPVESMILENFRAGILLREGKLNEAYEIGLKSQATWDSLPNEQKNQFLNNELGNICLAQGKYGEAKKFYQDLAKFCHDIGNLSKQAYALYGCAESHYFLEEFEEAGKLYQACAALSRQLKNEELLFHVYNGLGNLAYWQKDWVEAARCYQEALELSQHYLDIGSTVGIAINLGVVLHLQGDNTSALVYLNHVIETLEAQVPPSLHQVQFMARAYLELGHLHTEGREYLKARDAFRDATRLIRAYPALEKFRFSAFRGLVESDLKLGQYHEAEIIIQVMEKALLSTQQLQDLEELKEWAKDRPTLPQSDAPR